MVGLRVGDDEGVEPLDARLGKPAQDRTVGRSGVDQDRHAVLLEQGGVALADVQERDHELAARRRRHGAYARRAGDQREDRDERRDGDDVAAARPRAAATAGR